MEQVSIVTLGFILLALICFSAFCSAAEIGLMSLNRYRLRHLVRQKNKQAIKVNQLLSKPEKILTVILIGNTIGNIIASSVTTLICARYFGEWGIALGTLILTFVILIFAEIAPKSFAAIFPQKVAFLISTPLVFLQKFLTPMVWFSNLVVIVLFWIFRINLKSAKNEHLSGEELRTVVYEAGNLIPDEHKNMLIRILDLEKVTVDDIMVVRHDIVGIDLAKPFEDILWLLEKSQHTRLPIYKESLDEVLGLIHIRSVFHLLMDKTLNQENLLKVMEPAYFIPEGTPLNTQLMNFKLKKQRSAFVVDEYGEIKGLATLEDILEEIVGEFTSDFSAMMKEIFPQADGSILVDGAVMIRELNRSFDFHLPIMGPKTLSGLIIETLEMIPTPGTSLMIAGIAMEVIQVRENKVKMIRIIPQKRSV